ncbi:hypothetical protein [Paludisphaera borealis]|uniref:Methionine synthase n=1 Tax=Paludisphaera borealis TaxID=1387353 RepID=A0A1U7CWX3_9BACT|nr:hypothetical protein [Paludisphaera borealis]APW63389.1 hypothetical protein BSF38_04955 [Paludisphaera borealis]
MTSSSWTRLSPGCTTGVGSLPFLDADEAVEFVAKSCPELPFWPQLPRRTAGEGVIGQGMGRLVQYLEPISRPYCWTVRPGAGPLFAAALDGGNSGLIPETAAGFFALERAIRSGRFPAARAVKAQLEGPATLAHCFYLDGGPVSRIPGWLGRLAGFLERQAAWQVRRLRDLGLLVVFVLDEPALSLVDGMSPAAPAVASALRRVLAAARREGAAVGIHCCATLPSAAFEDIDLDLLSFDAHLPIADDFYSLARGILARGGRLAFGLAPTGPSSMTVESMESRWLALASLLGDPAAVVSQSLVTATCGLGLSSTSDTDSSFTLAQRAGDSIRSYAAARSSAGLP